MSARPLAIVLVLALAVPATAQDLPRPGAMDQCRAEHAASADQDARTGAARACSGRVIETCKAEADPDACLRRESGLWIRYAIFYDAGKRIARGEPRDLAMIRAGHGYPKLLEACPENDFPCALTAIIPTALDRMAAADADK